MFEMFIMLFGSAAIGFFLGWLLQKLQQDRLRADLRFTSEKLNASIEKENSLGKELTESRRIVDDLRARKDALVGELEEQKNSGAALEEKLALLAENSPGTAGPDPEQEALLETLRGQVAEALARASSLEAENIRLEKALREKPDSGGELQRLTEEVQRLEARYRELQDDYDDLEDRFDKREHAQAPDSGANTTRPVAETPVGEDIAGTAVVTDPGSLEEEEEEEETPDNEEGDDNDDADREDGGEQVVFATIDAGRETGSPDARNASTTPAVPPETPPIQKDASGAALTYEEYQRRKKALLESVGRSSESGKDPLGKIAGIGPYIEAKLHSIGIHNYNQIARLTAEDIEHITRLIEFFPGRISRDDWPGQARKLLEEAQKP